MFWGDEAGSIRAARSRSHAHNAGTAVFFNGVDEPLFASLRRHPFPWYPGPYLSIMFATPS